jgi:multidrug resistance efflux pump
MAKIRSLLSKNEPVSSEVEELINYRPHWIIRNGNMFFLIILFLMIASTWFVRYPDIIKGSLKLVAINAPKLLIAKTDGKLQKLLVGNDQEVQEGQPLAFMQSTANHLQVLELENWIQKVQPAIIKDSFGVLFDHPLAIFSQLGELQTDYQEFQSNLIETLQIFPQGYYQEKKRALLKDLTYLSSIQKNTAEEIQLLKEDYELQKIEYKANESLAKDKVIAPIELNQNKSKVIGKEQVMQQANSQIINNSLAEQDKMKEIMDLQKYIIDQKQKFRSALMNLKSKVEIWKQRYIIVAPLAGKVLFTSFLEENQLISSGQEMFYVEPEESKYYGQLMAPQDGLGKIKTGQKVLIRVESFPSTEFGYIHGTVSHISNIPTGRDSFLIKVDLPKGLQTNYNKTIVFRNDLLAQAEVLTDNRKLIDRFIGQLNVLIKR